MSREKMHDISPYLWFAEMYSANIYFGKWVAADCEWLIININTTTNNNTYDLQAWILIHSIIHPKPLKCPLKGMRLRSW